MGHDPGQDRQRDPAPEQPPRQARGTQVEPPDGQPGAHVGHVHHDGVHHDGVVAGDEQLDEQPDRVGDQRYQGWVGSGSEIEPRAGERHREDGAQHQLAEMTANALGGSGRSGIASRNMSA